MGSKRDDPGDEGDPERDAVLESADALLTPLDPKLRLLQGRDSREILHRIGAAEDPLGIATLSAERILQVVVFLDQERLSARALARIAYDAVADSHAGRPHLHGWLIGRVDQAIADLVREDYETLRQERPFPDVEHPYYVAFSELTGISPRRARETCARFNLLDPITREAFYCVAFEAQPIEMFAKAIDEPIDWVEERIAAATSLLEDAARQSKEDADDE